LYFDEGEPAVDVRLYDVKYSKLENALELSGEVVPSSQYSVMSETGGTVTMIHVFEGSRVIAGEALFSLDDTELTVKLKEARLRLDALHDLEAKAVLAQSGGPLTLAQEKAKLALALSQTTGYDYESFNEALGRENAHEARQVSSMLTESLSGIDSDFFETKTAVQGSEAQLAQLAVERLESAVERMVYKSKLTGTVVAVNVNRGEVLSPGLPAMVIADTDSVKIVGYVYEKDVKGLFEGMDVTIITDEGYTNGVIKKVGVSASGIGDLSAFDTMAKIEIEPDASFSKMVGAAVDIKIVLSSKADVLAVPIDSLTDDGCVFVVAKGDVAQKRAIVTGFEDAFYVEVTGGLFEGERIVAAARNLQEGQKIKYD
jgi:HlyD family secretion protein